MANRRTVEPFVPHVWADNDPSLSPSAERFNDMEKGILDAHVKPAGRAVSNGIAKTDHAKIVEFGVTPEYQYTPVDMSTSGSTAFDAFGMHPGRPTAGRGGRVYIPVNGVYLIELFAQSNLAAVDTGSRYIDITKNGVGLNQSRDRSATAADLNEQSVYHVGAFAAGDVVGFRIYHASGINDQEWRGLVLQWALLSYN